MTTITDTPLDYREADNPEKLGYALSYSAINQTLKEALLDCWELGQPDPVTEPIEELTDRICETLNYDLGMIRRAQIRAFVAGWQHAQQEIRDLLGDAWDRTDRSRNNPDPSHRLVGYDTLTSAVFKTICPDGGKASARQRFPIIPNSNDS